MKITQHFELDGVRFEASIESKNLVTHSKMQHLTNDEREKYLNQLFMILSDMTNALLDRKGS